MMVLKEAQKILAEITVTDEMVEKSTKAMLDKVHEWKATKLYSKQGGVPFEFKNGHIAWITTWTFGGDQYWNLTERGETIYIGYNAKECGKFLYKLGMAHRMMDNFLDCAK